MYIVNDYYIPLILMTMQIALRKSKLFDIWNSQIVYLK